MPLDLFANEFDAGQQRAMRETAPALPVPFDEAWNAAWRSGRLFSQSTAQTNTNALVFDEALDEVRQRTGVNAAAKINYDDPTRDPWQQLNDQIGEINAARPLRVPVSPYDDAEIRRRMVDKSRGALDDLAEVQGREQTFGGKIGLALGGLAAGGGDPLNLVAAPLVAPAGLGVLGSAMAWGVIGGATALASEAVGAGYREEVQPGYGAGAPGRVGEAALLGAATGGGLHALANVWSRVKTGAWPRSVRDAGNIVESEAQIADSARPPEMATAEGDRVRTELPLSAEGAVADEVAHREALSTAVDQVLRGDPVDVGIDVYHGSPHLFDRFDISRIGTGEGAQSFGHGLYFAESPEVAGSYRETLAAKRMHAPPGETEIRHEDGMWNVYVDGKFDNGFGAKSDAEAYTARGALYRVRINANPEHFVDWDRPLSEQRPEIQEAFKAAREALGKDTGLPTPISIRDFDPSKTVDQIATLLRIEASARGMPNLLEDELKARGIPGIKYLDQGSRGTSAREIAEAALARHGGDQRAAMADLADDARSPLATPETKAAWNALRTGAGVESLGPIPKQTRNYVVFDDNLLDITHINGEPVAKPAPEPAAPEPLPTAAAAEMRPETQAETIASPQMTQALAADLERLTIGEKPTLVPVGVDRDGNEIMASLDSLLHDAQMDADAATELEACAMPQPEEEAAE